MSPSAQQLRSTFQDGEPRLALITGGSRGIGRALAERFWAAGWSLILTGRDEAALTATARALTTPHPSSAADERASRKLHTIAGDISDPAHQRLVAQKVARRGGPLDLLVLNEGTLGPVPLPKLAELTGDELAATLEVNTVANHQLINSLAPSLRRGTAGHKASVVVLLTSDAAVEHYPGWGAYAASKAAAEHLQVTRSVEQPDLVWWAVDPGDVRTDLHQAAFPLDDISDRLDPRAVSAAFERLWVDAPGSGRYRLADWLVTTGTPVVTGSLS